MALRAEYLTGMLGAFKRRDYAKPLAHALLNENCKGAKALSDLTRAMLENLVSATDEEPPSIADAASIVSDKCDCIRTLTLISAFGTEQTCPMR
jgi:hypothetical protein